MVQPFNNNNKISTLGNVEFIPSSHIIDVKHYPNNILITTKEGILFVTKTFTIGVTGIVGDFIKQPN